MCNMTVFKYQHIKKALLKSTGLKCLFCRWKQLPLQKIPTYVRYRRQTAIYDMPYIYNALNGVRHAYF